MPKFEVLSAELAEQIRRDKEAGTLPQMAFSDTSVLRRNNLAKDAATIWRPTFVHDIDKILHCPYYNRYTDKTQVFSLWKNDDITRRSLHVQLVSRISRTIGSVLGLNLDLIDAIALGHDIGHTPFGHAGEACLDKLYFKETGRHFCHNLQSVRVLDGIFPYNISLQVLDGIATHNGEVEFETYYPAPLSSFEEFDEMIDRCYQDRVYMAKRMPSTLEGNVVRLADIIAYLGKDRQDAMRTGTAEEGMFINEDIGSINAEIINNLVTNIIENSYGKPYIKLDSKHFKALRKSKQDNYRMIYLSDSVNPQIKSTLQPMMTNIYGQLLDDLKSGAKYSPIFSHHIDYVNSNTAHYLRERPYESGEPNQIVVDYIASMTDDYLVELHAYLFPESDLKVQYKGYFDE